VVVLLPFFVLALEFDVVFFLFPAFDVEDVLVARLLPLLLLEDEDGGFD